MPPHIFIADQAGSMLVSLTPNRKPDDPLQKEIQDLTNRLQALLEQAETQRSAAASAILKTRI
jgi:hypothetical protein